MLCFVLSSNNFARRLQGRRNLKPMRRRDPIFLRREIQARAQLPTEPRVAPLLKM
jgi:hypothetical protein